MIILLLRLFTTLLLLVLVCPQAMHLRALRLMDKTPITALNITWVVTGRMVGTFTPMIVKLVRCSSQWQDIVASNMVALCRQVQQATFGRLCQQKDLMLATSTSSLMKFTQYIHMTVHVAIVYGLYQKHHNIMMALLTIKSKAILVLVFFSSLPSTSQLSKNFFFPNTHISKIKW